MTHKTAQDQALRFNRPPLAVQILAIIGFTGFAIPVSIIAMDQFGLLGIALTAFLAWQWTRLAGLGHGPTVQEAVDRLRPNEGGAMRHSGNSSFDTYRSELMTRLEDEQQKFEGFLTRLREAKDKFEFAQFMDDRARSVRTDARAISDVS